jgi:hypothetical protein
MRLVAWCSARRLILTEPQFDPTTMRDVSIPITDLLRPAFVLSFLLLIVPAIPYLLIWGFPESWAFGIGEILLVFLGLAVLVVAHEATHAIGWIVFGGVPVSGISFGVDKKTLSPYAHANVPMQANGYRIGAVLPLIVTGILPTIIGTIIGHGWGTFLGVFMIMGAVGDLLVLWAIRTLPADARVLDHPHNAGCYVLDEK